MPSVWPSEGTGQTAARATPGRPCSSASTRCAQPVQPRSYHPHAPGADLDAIAQGLTEVVDEDYLRYRVRTNDCFVGLGRARNPGRQAGGGHAVFGSEEPAAMHLVKRARPRFVYTSPTPAASSMCSKNSPEQSGNSPDHRGTPGNAPLHSRVLAIVVLKRGVGREPSQGLPTYARRCTSAPMASYCSSRRSRGGDERSLI